MRKVIYSLCGLALAGLVFAGAGCAGSGTTVPTSSLSPTSQTSPIATPNPSTTAAYAIQVMVNGGRVATLTVADLAKLPQVNANVEGTQEHGPTLLSALQLAGVKDFSQVVIHGYTKGRIATAELTLTKVQITDNVMLALVTRGTAKLTGTDIGSARAIIDVSEIDVQ